MKQEHKMNKKNVKDLDRIKKDDSDDGVKNQMTEVLKAELLGSRYITQNHIRDASKVKQ